jgi:hypothetical protein
MATKRKPMKKRTAARTAVAKKKPAARKAVARKKNAARAAATKKARRTPERRPSTLRTAAALVKGAVAAAAELLPWARNENDPIRLLETDHRRFEALFAEGEATTTRAVKGRARILASLGAELEVHELLEEKLLYPALAPHAEARDIVLEGSQEHHVADMILGELRRLKPTDQTWGPKFKVLKESIEHHIEEEEHRMFPIARSVLDGEALAALGARMRKLRAESGG